MPHEEDVQRQKRVGTQAREIITFDVEKCLIFEPNIGSPMSQDWRNCIQSTMVINRSVDVNSSASPRSREII